MLRERERGGEGESEGGRKEERELSMFETQSQTVYAWFDIQHIQHNKQCSFSHHYCVTAVL